MQRKKYFVNPPNFSVKILKINPFFFESRNFKNSFVPRERMEWLPCVKPQIT